MLLEESLLFLFNYLLLPSEELGTRRIPIMVLEMLAKHSVRNDLEVRLLHTALRSNDCNLQVLTILEEFPLFFSSQK